MSQRFNKIIKKNFKLIFMIMFFLLIIEITSCKKTNEVKVYYSKSYINTFNGEISKIIIDDFLKEYNFNSSFIEISPKEKNMSKYEKTIIIANDEYKYFLKKKDIFSKALYFLIHEEDFSSFKYPDSLKTEKSGVLYQSDESTYFSANFKGEPLYYSSLSKMIEDFLKRKTKIILLSRENYYKNILILPGVYIFFIEYEDPYGNIFFSDKTLIGLFEDYTKSKNIKEHEWVSVVKKSKFGF